jgi:hypothetical protein
MPRLEINKLEDLIVAILSLVRDRGGFATKTKLLKLLYLADIEGYRDTGETLTGFEWSYHLYGPWSEEYDVVLDRMARANRITIRPGSRPDLETQFIQASSPVSFDSVVGPPAVTWLALRRAVETWASEPTGELLNYVYFHTEPMQGARDGDRINFSAVAPRGELRLYRRTKSSATAGDLRKARERFSAFRVRVKRPETAFTPPSYDEVFFGGMASLDETTD